MNPVLAALRQSITEVRNTVAGVTEWQNALTRIVDRAQEILEIQGCVHFDPFWKIYPRKDGKDSARNAWRRMDGDQHAAAIMLNVRQHIHTNDWNPSDVDRRRFIPHASTYISQRRWLDPVVPGERRD